jgi:hypothetical protein
VSLEDAKRDRDMWFNLHWCWQAAHWVSMVFIAAGSALVASQVANGTHWRDALAAAVAVVSAGYAVLQPGAKAQAYRQAWITLRVEVMRQEGADPKILDAILAGEKHITSGVLGGSTNGNKRTGRPQSN